VVPLVHNNWHKKPQYSGSNTTIMWVLQMEGWIVLLITAEYIPHPYHFLNITSLKLFPLMRLFYKPVKGLGVHCRVLCLRNCRLFSATFINEANFVFCSSLLVRRWRITCRSKNIDVFLLLFCLKKWHSKILIKSVMIILGARNAIFRNVLK
jgi:hypothetical protein